MLTTYICVSYCFWPAGLFFGVQMYSPPLHQEVDRHVQYQSESSCTNIQPTFTPRGRQTRSASIELYKYTAHFYTKRKTDTFSLNRVVQIYSASLHQEEDRHVQSQSSCTNVQPTCTPRGRQSRLVSIALYKCTAHL